MFFTVSLYTSLAILLIGLIYKIGTWFTRQVGMGGKGFTTGERVGAAIKGILAVLFSARLGTLIKAFFVDVLWQQRILKEDGLRWIMHMLIFWGFTLLLLMHALGSILTVAVFPDYASTLNPYMFLRNLFGAMVVVGVAIAIYRRFILKVPRLRTSGMDKYAILILAVIILSGIFLEAVKITSHTDFMRMVEDYADSTDPEDVRPLESYWVEHFGVVSPTAKAPFDAETLAAGGEMHEMSCAACHSAPQWAFTGYPLAKIISPIALGLDRAGASTFLWYMHLWACFFGLAYLPFSKMFHLFATPVSLLANAVMSPETSDPANIATRQVMELDACTHCGTCSLRCSAAGAFAAMGNECILPSEKMAVLKKWVSRKTISPEENRALIEGVWVCTSCDRCTVVCPSGINLREMWLNLREVQFEKGYADPVVLSPLSYVVGMFRKGLASDDYPEPSESAKKRFALDFEALRAQNQPIALHATASGKGTALSRANTFSYCFGCQNCTTVCPVVGSYEEPEKALGLLPHQIMCSLGLGLVDMAAGSRMIWDCLTCYQCQEHCPQNVRVTDILYELKHVAIRNQEKSAEKIGAPSQAA